MGGGSPVFLTWGRLLLCPPSKMGSPTELGDPGFLRTDIGH